MITIEINTENDAFFENETPEVIRILENVVDNLKNDLYRTTGEYNLRDYNGNTVGTLNIKED
jgi:hypothetical protein